MTCPSCGNSDIRPSEHSYWSDTWQSMFGRKPYRCRKCRHRFYSSETPPPAAEGTKRSGRAQLDPIHEAKRRRKRLLRGLIAVAIFAAMFLIFLMILSYLTSDKGAPKEIGEIQSLSAISAASANRVLG
jgi:hypothetical protein